MKNTQNTNKSQPLTPYKKSPVRRSIILIIVLIVVFLAFLRMYLYTTSQNTRQNIKTENWKTYKSDVLKFSIQYPPDWTIKTNLHSNGVIFYPTKYPEGFPPLFHPGYYIGIARITKQEFQDSTAALSQAKYKTEIINGISFKKFEFDESYYAIGNLEDGSVISLDLDPYWSDLSANFPLLTDPANKYLDIANKMLSTFKLTN